VWWWWKEERHATTTADAAAAPGRPPPRLSRYLQLWEACKLLELAPVLDLRRGSRSRVGERYGSLVCGHALEHVELLTELLPMYSTRRWLHD
jgi:hypothetical protein